jgi:aspartyl-tRNA(Asn)/glutamyl-tRNA(Gln) amidotransferase subunit C
VPVSIEEVERIARLAMLSLSPREKVKFTRQLNLILQYMEQLNQVDTSETEPMSHPLGLTNVFREDEVRPSLPVEEALKNAPDKSGNYFRVPKVIQK